MTNWWEHIEDGDAQARQLAFFNTLCRGEGKRVFAWLRNYPTLKEGLPPEARLAILDMISQIRAFCGITDIEAVIDAEAKIASKYEPPKPEQKTDLLELG
jgi:hypothetical protein